MNDAGTSFRCLVGVALPLDVAAARLLLFNLTLARQRQGVVGVRCRVEPSSSEASALLDDLRWLGIAADTEFVPDPAPEAGRTVLDDLAKGGRTIDRAGAVVLPLGPGSIRLEDAVKGAVCFDHAALGDPVLVDAAGNWTPVFRAAVADLTFGTTFVLREDRELEHTALEQQLFQALDRGLPRWAHAGVVLPDLERGELPTVAYLREIGIEPAALVEHLALLGWSPTGLHDWVSLADFAAVFDLDRVGRGPMHFNEPRLRAFNARALHALPRAELSALLTAAMQRAGLLESPIPAAALRWVALFLDAYADAFATMNEALALVAELRAEAVVVPALELERLRNRGVLFYLDAVGQYVDSQPELRDLPLTHDLAIIAQEFGVGHSDAFAAVRMALTGKHDGAPLTQLFPLLGHDRVLMRIGAISSHLLHGRGLEPIKFGPRGVPFQTIQSQRPATSDP